MKLANSTIIVHGGAGKWPKNQHAIGLAGVQKAATRGFQILKEGGSSIQAVEAGVIEMEDNPIFNAGKGSTLNLAGNVEADAGIMDGETLRGAGVALLHHVKNPISLARLVMEKTDHALLAGKTAERLGEAYGLPVANLRTPERVRQWRQERHELEKRNVGHFPRNLRLLQDKRGFFLRDTVGALALDRKGNLAAADSTGGVSLKLPGRIGDSAILGAGLYADDRLGAATATGIGEIAMRLVVSKSACDAMRLSSAQRAASKTVRDVTRLAGIGLGIITLDRKGRYGIAHNTPHLCWAALTEGVGLVSQMVGGDR